MAETKITYTVRYNFNFKDYNIKILKIYQNIIVLTYTCLFQQYWYKICTFPTLILKLHVLQDLVPFKVVPNTTGR